MHQFQHGDLVWAHVPSYPWWPGEIYDSSDPSVPHDVLQNQPSSSSHLVRFINESTEEFYWFKQNDPNLVSYTSQCDKLENQAKVWKDSNLLWSINEVRARLGKGPLEKPAGNKRKRKADSASPKSTKAGKKAAAASPKRVKKSPVTPVDPPKKKRKVESLAVEPVVKPVATKRNTSKKSRVVGSPADEGADSMEDIIDHEVSESETKAPPPPPKEPVPRKIVKTTVSAAQTATPSPVPSTARPVEKEQISDDELRDLYTQLQEAQQNNNDAQLIYTLKHIDERCIISIEQLRKIKIAMEINKLRKSSNEQVKRLASVITSRFKSIVKRMSVNTQSKSGNNNSPVTPASSNSGGAAPKKAANHSQPSQDEDLSPTTAATASKSPSKEEKAEIAKDIKERVSMQSLDPLRAYFREQIGTILANHKDKIESSLTLACELEEAVYNQYMKQGSQNKNQYKSQLNSIKFNLRDKSNPDFKQNVEDGTITPQKLAVMKSQDMASDAIQKRRKDIKKEEIRKSTVAKAEARAGGMFTCRKCKSDKVHTYELQTRSADEPMTVFASCTNCGHRWRFGG